MARVNLIPAQFRHRRQLRLRRKAWISAFVAYATTLILIYGTWRVAMVSPSSTLSAEVTRLDAEITEKSAEARSLKSQLAENHDVVRVAQSMAAQPDWGILLALLAETRGNEIVLKRCEIAAPGELLGADTKTAPVITVLRLAGIGTNQASVSKFALRLEQSGLFESIEPVSNRETFDHGEVVGFRFECRFATAAKTPVNVAGIDQTGATP